MSNAFAACPSRSPGRPKAALCIRGKSAIAFQAKPHERKENMAMYVSLLQFTEQGIRNVKDTIKRGSAATAEAEKMGVKVIDSFWTMGAYDVLLLLDASNDDTATSFYLKIDAQGN